LAKRSPASGRLVAGYHLARLLVRNPRDARHARRYLASMAPGRSPLADGQPWMSFAAIEWLDANVSASASVFEYGSGGTTLFLADRAGSVHSVEHDPDWARQTRAALDTAGHSGVRYELIEAEPGAALGYESTDESFTGMNFRRYVDALAGHPDRTLDLVIVDGRARVACIRTALPKLREGGHLMLDNSERSEYAEGVAMLEGLERTDFRGLGPYHFELSQTTVWRVRVP
jgi:hypothetical protein